MGWLSRDKTTGGNGARRNMDQTDLPLTNGLALSRDKALVRDLFVCRPRRQSGGGAAICDVFRGANINIWLMGVCGVETLAEYDDRY